MKVISWLTVVAIIFSSCQSPEESVESLALQQSPTETFRIDPAKDTIILGTKGTKIKIQANSLLLQEGGMPSGTVKFQLKECYTKEDFINNGLSTVTTDGRLLQSSGMVFLNAFSNGAKLKVNKEKPLEIYFKRVVDAEVYPDLFVGEVNRQGIIEWKVVESDDIEIYYDTVRWIRPTWDFALGERDSSWSNGDTVWIAYDSRTSAYDQMDARDYFYTVSDMGWINCDFFVDEAVSTKLITTNGNASLYLVFSDLNSVMMGWESNKGNYQFTVPEGKEVALIGYRNDKGKHYFNFERLNTSDLDGLSMALEEAPLDSVKTWIKKLI